MVDLLIHAKGISCTELVKRMDVSEPPLAILDVRPLSAYSLSHIKGAFAIQLSSIHLRRLASQKISFLDVILSDQKERFKDLLARNADIVVYDEATETINVDQIRKCKKPIPLPAMLGNLLSKGHDCYYLQGGFSSVEAGFEMCEIPEAKTAIKGTLALNCQSKPINSPDTPIERHSRDNGPAAVLNYLLVGAEAHAENKELLLSLGITHILNLTTRSPKRFAEFTYHNIPLHDSWDQHLSQHYESAFDFIRQCKASGGKVLVHCVAGISRSPTMAIAYLIKEEHLTLTGAFLALKAKRPSIAPNLDFMTELERFERTLYGDQARGWVFDVPKGKGLDASGAGQMIVT